MRKEVHLVPILQLCSASIKNDVSLSDEMRHLIFVCISIVETCRRQHDVIIVIYFDSLSNKNQETRHCDPRQKENTF